MASIHQLIIAVVLLASVVGSSLVGGWAPAKVDDEGVLRAASFAELKINEASNNYYANKLTKIIEAEKQVVSGTKYRLTIQLTETECKRDKVENLDSCKLKKNAKVQTCTVDVWEQLWVPSIELLKFNCDNKNNTKNKTKNNAKN